MRRYWANARRTTRGNDRSVLSSVYRSKCLHGHMLTWLFPDSRLDYVTVTRHTVCFHCYIDVLSYCQTVMLILGVDWCSKTFFPSTLGGREIVNRVPARFRFGPC